MCWLQPAACRRQIVEGGSDETVLICRALGPNVPHLYSPGCNNTLICTEIRGKVFIDSRYAEPRPTDGTEPKYDWWFCKRKPKVGGKCILETGLVALWCLLKSYQDVKMYLAFCSCKYGLHSHIQHFQLHRRYLSLCSPGTKPCFIFLTSKINFLFCTPTENRHREEKLCRVFYPADCLSVPSTLRTWKQSRATVYRKLKSI